MMALKLFLMCLVAVLVVMMMCFLIRLKAMMKLLSRGQE